MFPIEKTVSMKNLLLRPRVFVLWALFLLQPAASATEFAVSSLKGDCSFRDVERVAAFVQTGHSNTETGGTVGAREIFVSADEKVVMTLGQDGVVKFWDAADTRELATFSCQSALITGITYAHLTKKLFVANRTGEVFGIDVNSARTGFSRRVADGPAAAISVDRAGRCLATVSADVLSVWNADSLDLICKVSVSTPRKILVRDRGEIVVLGLDGLMTAYSASKCARLDAFGAAQDVRVIAVSQVDVVVSVTDEGEVTFWNPTLTGAINKIPPFRPSPRAAIFTGVGANLTVLSTSGLQLLPNNGFGPSVGVDIQSFSGPGIAAAPKGLYFLDGFGLLKLLAMSTTVPPNSTPLPIFRTMTVKPLRGGGELLLATDGSSSLHVWDAKTGAFSTSHDFGIGTISSASAISSNSFGSQVVAGSETGKLALWDRDTNTQIVMKETLPRSVSSALFTDDNAHVLFASDGVTYLATIPDLKIVDRFKAASEVQQYVDLVSAGADERYFNVGRSGDVRRLAVRNRRLVAESQGSARKVPAALLHPPLFDVGTKTLLLLEVGGEVSAFDINLKLKSIGDESRFVGSPIGAWHPRKKIITTANNSGKFTKISLGEPLESRGQYAAHSAAMASMTYSETGTLLHSTASDKVLRTELSADSRELTRTFMANDRTWITITPEGYFAASSALLPSAVRMRTGSALQDVADISGFWETFHRPDLVRRKLAGEDIRPYIGDLTIEKALQSPPPKVTMGKAPPETKSDRLKIPYTITPDSGGVAEVRAFHNGKLVMSDGTYKDAVGKSTAIAANSVAAPLLGPDGKPRSINVSTLRTAIPRAASASDATSPVPLTVNVTGAASGSGANANNLPADLIVRSAPEKKCNPCTGEIEVDVIPGEENTITVVAFNRDNTIQSLPASVTFKSTLPKEAPKLWVLSVGIDKFKDIGALKNARKDASDFACTYAGKQALQRSTGASARATPIACDQPGTANGLFKPENVNIIDVQLDDKATKANVLAQLDEVAKRAKPQDTFVLFVASHGTLDANGLFGIVAHDTQCTGIDPKTKECTQLRGYISSNEILEASKQIKAMKQLMVLDTCHSGGLDNKLSGLYDARMSVLAKNMGLHLYASAQATEAAQDGISGTNGTFTAQLLAGIKGAAKQDAEGNISIVSLGEYAKQKTIEATQPKANTSVATNASNAKGSTTSTQAAQTPVIQHFGVDAPVARGR